MSKPIVREPGSVRISFDGGHTFMDHIVSIQYGEPIPDKPLRFVNKGGFYEGKSSFKTTKEGKEFFEEFLKSIEPLAIHCQWHNLCTNESFGTVNEKHFCSQHFWYLAILAKRKFETIDVLRYFLPETRSRRHP